MYTLERLHRETGRDYALRTIKQNIIRLTLEPGSLLSENELALEMGLSRTPVREALIELSKVKIVEIYPQRGSVISLIDYDMVEQARFMRNVLEKAVVKLVCETIQPKQLAELEENLSLQQLYLNSGNLEKFLEGDNTFHQQLFFIANKMQVYDLMNSLTIHFDRVRSMALYVVKDAKIVEDHRAILEAIRRKDSDAACQLMEKHLSRYKIDEQHIRQKYPDYFK